jgi:integrase
MAPRATGHIRVVDRKRGPVVYAKLRLPDGREPQRALGRLWTKRSKPPEGYLTRGMAHARLEAILAGDDPLVNIAPTHVTFEAACVEWLAYVEHDRKRRKSTVTGYRNIVHGSLLDEFGRSTPIDDITTAEIESYRRRLVKDGKLAAATINRRLVALHAIFKLAVRRHGLASNPVEAAERQPQRRTGDFRVLDPGDVALLASNAENAQDAALYTVAAFTGLRLGELLALRWSDIDFAKRLVHVRRSHVLGREDTPKSHKARSVPLIDQAARALDQLSRREHFTGDEDRVFVNPVGDVLGQDLLRRRFKTALAAAKLKPMRLHDLRHTFGTLAVQAFPLSDVKAFMGHANIDTTMIYVHHVPQHDAADRLGALVAQAESVPPNVPRTGVMPPQPSATERTENG